MCDTIGARFGIDPIRISNAWTYRQIDWFQRLCLRDEWRQREFQRLLVGCEKSKEPDFGLDSERKSREFSQFMAMDGDMPESMMPPDPTTEKGSTLFNG